MSKSIIIEEKFVLDYITQEITDLFRQPVSVNDANYHHNTSYDNASSIIRNGILPISELNSKGIISISDDMLKRMDDVTSHPNGINGVSLAVVGLKDLYSGEMEYNPKDMNSVDFLVTDSIAARRNSTNYGNEFICFDHIQPSQLRSVDIRILKFLDYCKKSSKQSNIQKLIMMYNCLQDTSNSIKENRLDIPLREMSQESNICLDIDQIAKIQKIVLKR